MTTDSPRATATYNVPAIIKRNTALFALSQTFTGAGMQFAYGFGPLMVMQLTGSAALSGLTIAMLGFSRFIVAYPMGRLTDAYGRKPGIMVGLVMALAGALANGAAMAMQSYVALFAGMLVFAMGMNAAQQLRVAATDMYPPHRRAEALGYVALGSLFGLVVAPLMVSASERLAPLAALDPLAMPWLMVPLLVLPGMVLVSLVRPDPKEIGMNLHVYYPGLAPQRASGPAAPFDARDLMRNRTTLLAIVSNSAAHGNMTIVMVLTSLVLSHHGHSLSAIAFSHMFHSMGMFAFTIPLGRLADRFGNEKVMYPGVAVALIGAALVAMAVGYWTVTLGTFLVGIGWAAANVAATASIAECYESSQRGRAIGVSESWAGAMSTLVALVTGPLVEWGGLSSTGLAAVLIALPPLVMRLALPPRRDC